MSETINSGYSWEMGLDGRKREISLSFISFCAVRISCSVNVKKKEMKKFE